MSYLELQYNEDRQPKTDFPIKLIRRLTAKFGLMPLLQGRNVCVLDIGCGRGDFTSAWRRVAAPWVDVVGVDREVVHIGTVWCDVAKDPLPVNDSHVSLVFSKSLIEHLHQPANLLENVHRVLKPGGRVIIMCPDWRTYMKTFYDDFTHVRPYDVVSLADLLRYHGFTDVSCERIYQYPPLWDNPFLQLLALAWRFAIPVEASLWLSRKTGVGFFRWASQLTLLAYARKPYSKEADSVSAG